MSDEFYRGLGVALELQRIRADVKAEALSAAVARDLVRIHFRKQLSDEACDSVLEKFAPVPGPCPGRDTKEAIENGR